MCNSTESTAAVDSANIPLEFFDIDSKGLFFTQHVPHLAAYESLHSTYNMVMTLVFRVFDLCRLTFTQNFFNPGCELGADRTVRIPPAFDIVSDEVEEKFNLTKSHPKQ